MHTRQLPVGAGSIASSRALGHSAISRYPSRSAYGADAAFAGPVTYLYQPIAPTNSAAIVGMVLSLMGALTGFFPASIVGIIMGHIARRQIRRRGERGNGMALTALWVGYLGAGFWALIWLVYFGTIVVVILAAIGAEVSVG